MWTRFRYDMFSFLVNFWLSILLFDVDVCDWWYLLCENENILCIAFANDVCEWWYSGAESCCFWWRTSLAWCVDFILRFLFATCVLRLLYYSWCVFVWKRRLILLWILACKKYVLPKWHDHVRVYFASNFLQCGNCSALFLIIRLMCRFCCHIILYKVIPVRHCMLLLTNYVLDFEKLLIRHYYL